RRDRAALQADPCAPRDVTGSTGGFVTPDRRARSFGRLRERGRIHLAADRDDDVCLVEPSRPGIGPTRLQYPCRPFWKCAELDFSNLDLGLSGLQQLEHPRADRRELRRRVAHDHRDDVPSVGRLVLNQPAASVDPEIDAIGGHPVLELSGDARSEVAAAQSRGEEQHMRPLALDDRSYRGDPPLRYVVEEPIVFAGVDHVRAVARDVFDRARDVRAEYERDVRAAELARELPSLREQLERRACRAAVGDLDKGPAVVEIARLLRNVLGPRPGSCAGGPLSSQLPNSRGRFLDRVKTLAGSLRRAVVDGEDPRRRAGLPEPLVVLAQVVDEIGCGPDVDWAFDGL